MRLEDTREEGSESTVISLDGAVGNESVPALFQISTRAAKHKLLV